jgi:guanine nucleotide-binding protein G(i) subunit alpha
MGLCASVDALTEQEKRQAQLNRQVTKKIDVGQKKDAAKDRIVKKLLLLGAGESGKSTLFKQMIKIYGTGFPEEERKNYTDTVHTNLVLCMKLLCEATRDHDYGVVDCKDALEYVVGVKDEDTAIVDSSNVHHYKALWADPCVRNAYEHRSQFQLPDSANYFFDRLDAIAEAGYIPTEQDILRTRVKSSGIVVNDFLVDGNEFKMIDVGGQRNERKKWISCFEGVTAVLFIGVLSEYDLTLHEDHAVNRMVETLTVFEEICNSPFFQRTAMILMLNKRDAFLEKIPKVPLNVCSLFSDYTGPNDYDSCLKLIQEAFLVKAKNKLIYTHVTCATDTDNMKVVFEAVKDIVIRAALNDVGLLG